MINWISKLNLIRHIEGGWYSEVYRSALEIDSSYLPHKFGGKRSVCTHIYFLLEQGDFSAFHRIQSDELWHFYSGGPIVIYEIDEQGILHEHILGNDPELNQVPFTVVKAGSWFGSRVKGNGEYGLVGCTVAPGFDFNDFELAKRDSLASEFPSHSEIIRELTRQ